MATYGSREVVVEQTPDYVIASTPEEIAQREQARQEFLRRSLMRVKPTGGLVIQGRDRKGRFSLAMRLPCWQSGNSPLQQTFADWQALHLKPSSVK